MILKKSKRILAFTLLLAMLLSILPPVAFAAESETRWNPIAFEDITSDHTIAITMSKGDTTYILPAAPTTKAPLGDTATVSETQLLTNGEAAAYGWTITPVTGGYHITAGNSCLYTTNSNNGVRIGSTKAIWKIDNNYLYSTNTGRYLGVYTTNPDWRCYTSINTNIEGQTLGFWALDNGTSGPSCDHSWDHGTTTATCTEAGVTTYTCSLCGETKKEDAPATGHDYTNGVCKTCGAEEAFYKLITLENVKAGNYIIGAKRGKTYPDIYPATSKISSGDWVVSDTFITAANDAITADQLPKDAQVIVLDGDNTNGFTIGFKVDGVIKYLGYTSIADNRTLKFSEEYVTILWTIIADEEGGFALSTPIEGGKYVISQNSTGSGAIRGYKSGAVYDGIYLFAEVTEAEPEDPTETECGHAKTVDIPAKDATCTKDGNTAGVVCEDCGEVLSGNDVILSTGHSMNEGIVTTDPTCTEEGVKTFSCSACDYKETEVVSATGHNMVNGTCTACGLTEAAITPGQYVIAANVNGTYYAMGNTFGDKIAGTSVTVTDGQITEADAQNYMVTLSKVDGGWTIQSPGGNYLKYVSSTNLGKSADPYTWIFTEGTKGTWRISAQTAGRALAFRAGTFNTFRGYSTDNIKSSGTEYYDVELIPVMTIDAELYSCSISLNGNIAVNFFMNLSDKVSADPNAYMLFKQEGKEGEVKVYIQDSVERSVRGTKAYRFSYEVSAKEMTDTITAQFFYGDTATEEYTYSVKSYADNQREKLADDQALLNLLDAMLHYGAASQIQSDYHTERLANEGLEPVEYIGPSTEDFPTNLPQGTDLISFAGATLLLRSETTLRFFLRVDESVESFTVTYEGQPLEINARSGLYYVDVENISAPDLDETFTITVNDGTGTAEISYSALAYCASVYKNGNSIHSEALRTVVAAIYMYNTAANAYFSAR